MAVVCANGAMAQLGGILEKRNCGRILLVAGRTSLQRSGAEVALESILRGYRVTRFTGIDENPKIGQLESGLKIFREVQPDLIIGVGGGSAMDMAKLIKIFSCQPHPPLRYIEGSGELRAATVPLLAIPTTAGSGSQATHFAVLYVDKSKHSVAHASMLPDEAIVDPMLLRSVPPAVAASTGLDALNQGIESYWSIHATIESKALAGSAIKLACASLHNIVRRPDDAAYLAMATAAHRAGEAINLTMTTAPHAISYPITSYFGVPHGQATGLVLAAVLRYNSMVSADDCLDSRGPEYVRDTICEIAGLLGQTDAMSAASAYNAMMDAIGLSRDFLELGIRTSNDLETIVENGFNPQRVRNNPRRVTSSALRNMLIELQHPSSVLANAD